MSTSSIVRRSPSSAGPYRRFRLKQRRCKSVPTEAGDSRDTAARVPRRRAVVATVRDHCMLALQRRWDPTISSFGVEGRCRQRARPILHQSPDSSSHRARRQSSSSSSTRRICRQSNEHRRQSHRGPPSTIMDRLLRTLTSLKDVAWGQGQPASSGSVRGDDDDDWADRLSRRYMSTTFAILSVAVTTKQLVGEPISCWCPAFFEESHRIYTNSICWISNTFYVPFDVSK